MTQTPTRILPRPHGRLPQTTHLHKVKIKTCSDRIHCQHNSKNSTPPSKSQVSCPGLTNLVCSSTGTTVDSLPGFTSVQSTKHTPCQYLSDLQTKSRPTKQIHDPHDPYKSIHKTKSRISNVTWILTDSNQLHTP